MFDKLRIGDTAKEAKPFTPVHPDPSIGKKHGITIMLHGKHSEVYRNSIAAAIRKGNKGGSKSAEEMVEESARHITACASGWQGVTDAEGKAKKFDRKKLFEILCDDDFRWMRLQAEQFMQQDDNFF